MGAQKNQNYRIEIKNYYYLVENVIVLAHAFAKCQEESNENPQSIKILNSYEKRGWIHQYM